MHELMKDLCLDSYKLNYETQNWQKLDQRDDSTNLTVVH